MRVVSLLCIPIVDGELDITTMDPNLLAQIQDNQQLGKLEDCLTSTFSCSAFLSREKISLTKIATPCALSSIIDKRIITK